MVAAPKREGLVRVAALIFGVANYTYGDVRAIC
jgi:hypothetical protein